MYFRKYKLFILNKYIYIQVIYILYILIKVFKIPNKFQITQKNL